MRTMIETLAGVATVLVMTGCGQMDSSGTGEPLGEAYSALTLGNGSNLNGSNLNGSNLNGSNLNGSNLNGQALNETLISVSFSNASVQGGSVLDAAWLAGTVFQGLKGSSRYSGLDFVQAEFDGTLGSGAVVRLRVDSASQAPAPNADVWRYVVRYRDPSGAWWPMCKGASGAVAAIPLEGRWSYASGVPGGGSKTQDPSVFTLACLGSAIAKCVEAGYKPWVTAQGTPLADHHQACTRLLRADFCGDGTSHTSDGRWVNLYDALGVQADTEFWLPEAEWGVEGALCVDARTRSGLLPPCGLGQVRLGCGVSFGPGTLLISEVPLF